MKRTQTARAACARPDCTDLARDRGYCIRCIALVRRWGVPYRRDEQDDHRSGNTMQQEMDAALNDHPPVIEWAPNGKGILVAVSIYDPHTKDRKRGKAA